MRCAGCLYNIIPQLLKKMNVPLINSSLINTRLQLPFDSRSPSKSIHAFVNGCYGDLPVLIGLQLDN